MSIAIVSPQTWGCPPPKKRQVPADLTIKHAIAHHWLGDIALDEAHDPVARMQNMPRYEMAKWSYPAYDFAVDPAGTVYGIHMMETESFAEGPIPRKQDPRFFWRGSVGWWPEIYGGHFRQRRSFNRYHISILWLLGRDYIPPKAMVDAVIELQQFIVARAPSVKCVVPHSGLRRKNCPGPAVTQLIDDQTLGPSPGLGMFAPWPWDKPQPALASVTPHPRHPAPEPAVDLASQVSSNTDAITDLGARVARLEAK